MPTANFLPEAIAHNRLFFMSIVCWGRYKDPIPDQQLLKPTVQGTIVTLKGDYPSCSGKPGEVGILRRPQERVLRGTISFFGRKSLSCLEFRADKNDITTSPEFASFIISAECVARKICLNRFLAMLYNLL